MFFKNGPNHSVSWEKLATNTIGTREQNHAETHAKMVEATGIVSRRAMKLHQGYYIMSVDVCSVYVSDNWGATNRCCIPAGFIPIMDVEVLGRGVASHKLDNHTSMYRTRRWRKFQR